MAHRAADHRGARDNISRNSGLPCSPPGIVSRNGRYESSGDPCHVTTNCSDSEIDITEKEINHYDLTFTNIEENNGRGGRGRGHRQIADITVVTAAVR